MTSSYSVLAYWGPRRESPEACAPKLMSTFDALAQIEPSISRWFCADPDSGKPRLVSLNLQDAVRLIADGQSLSEIERRPNAGIRLSRCCHDRAAIGAAPIGYPW